MDRLYLVHTFRRTLFGQNQLSVPSRFLADIPPDLAEKQPSSPVGKYVQSEQPTSRLELPVVGSVTRWSSGGAATAPAVARFEVGDTVTHTAFGEGVVIKTHLTGDDQEIEVAFPDRGNKKLSVNFAPLVKK